MQSFNDHRSMLLDSVAPLKIRGTAVCNASPWMTDCLRPETEVSQNGTILESEVSPTS